MGRPLSGVRVLEFTNAVAGPVAGLVLSDLGAEVIKLEPPSRGDPAVVGPLRPGAPDRPYNRVPLFNELNRGKLSLAVDLARPGARQLFLRLAAACDIVLQNYSPQVLTRLGLEYEHLRAVRPDIIVVSIPAFGSWGPLRERRAYGPGVDAMSGLCHLTGYGDGRPFKPGNFFCDYNAGLLAALGAMAALRRRRLSGQGCYLECALLDSELPLVADALMDAAMNGRVQGALGNRHPHMAPHGLYPCLGQDRWLAIACPDDAAFAALARAMGRPELPEDPRFSTCRARLRHQEELDAIVAAWSRTQDGRQAMERLQREGVPAAVVQDAGDLAADPQYRHRRYFHPLDHPEMGPYPVSRLAFRYQRLSALPQGPAPLFSQHADYVLRELLGLGQQEVEELYRSGVVVREPRVPQAQGEA
jgi:crotonobetainyl-CoA:carnitine CoA-transferase CaiB-like acyl-CoA transferase